MLWVLALRLVKCYLTFDLAFTVVSLFFVVWRKNKGISLSFYQCALIRVLNASALVMLCDEEGVHCSHNALAIAAFSIRYFVVNSVSSSCTVA